jgi:hypothetical protein
LTRQNARPTPATDQMRPVQQQQADSGQGQQEGIGRLGALPAIDRSCTARKQGSPSGTLPKTRCASLPHAEPVAEAPAGPWGWPESFGIQGWLYMSESPAGARLNFAMRGDVRASPGDRLHITFKLYGHGPHRRQCAASRRRARPCRLRLLRLRPAFAAPSQATRPDIRARASRSASVAADMQDLLS